MVANIPQVLSALNFSVNAIFIRYCFSQVLEICHVFKGFISNQHMVILSAFICTTILNFKHLFENPIKHNGSIIKVTIKVGVNFCQRGSDISDHVHARTLLSSDYRELIMHEYR